MLVSKESTNYLFFLMQVVIILLMKIHIENIFFQELKQKITISKLMVEIFMINQLMIQLNNMMKLEKYQQEKVMITLQVVCQIFLISKKNYKLIAVDLSKQKVLDADSKAIQQIIFVGHADAQIRVYYIPDQSKETILEFSKRNNKSFADTFVINFVAELSY